MKKSILFALVLGSAISTQARADIDPSKLVGAWKLNCTQSQGNGHQGYLSETYTFSAPGSYQLSRLWYSDPGCTTQNGSESESGTITLGGADTNNGFNPSNTVDAQYKTPQGTELGLLWVDAGYTTMRIARGFGSSQNTMLGLFQYHKQ